MKVAIYSRGLDIEQGNPLQLLVELLVQQKIGILLYRSLLARFPLPEALSKHIIPFESADDFDPEVECLISLGGDGTMLDAVTLIRNTN
ncbi:MAG: NAD(+) kinase, partial [Bacteroidota bacterium]|nr:NAD(+) kinase [Bacteroidota bacterium]